MGVNGKASHLVVSSKRGWYHFDLHPNLIWKGKQFCIRHYSLFAQISSPYTPLLLPVPIIFNAFIYPLKIKSLRMCDVAIIHPRHKHLVDCYRILPLLGLNRVLDFRRISEYFWKVNLRSTASINLFRLYIFLNFTLLVICIMGFSSLFAITSNKTSLYLAALSEFRASSKGKLITLWSQNKTLTSGT